MQISDMLGQYSRNTTNGTEELRSARGVQKLVSTLNELSAGSIFEGTVNSIRNGKVTIALGNGQLISARLDGKVSIQQGASMFFQVKANDGMTVAIRPYTGMGNSGNPILLNALTAAGIPVSDRNLAMVDAMIKEQMPIGKNSILEMVKALGNHPDIDVEALVKMTKLGIPTTKEMAAQFQNYMADRHAIMNEMESALKQIADAIGDEKLSSKESFSLYSKIVDIIQGRGVEADGQVLLKADGQVLPKVDPSMLTKAGEQAAEVRPFQFGQIVEPPGAADGQAVGGNTAAGVTVTPEQAQQKGAEAANGQQTEASNPTRSDLTSENSAGMEQTHVRGAEQADTHGVGQGAVSAAVNGETTLGQLFSDEQLTRLTRQIEGVPLLAGNRELFPVAEPEEVFVDTMSEEIPEEELLKSQEHPEKAVLEKDMPVQKFLSVIQDAFAENGQYGFTGLKKLFSSREFKEVLRSAVKEQWTIKPEELTEENKINKLYGKLDQQMHQMESAMKQAGVTSDNFTQTAADIRNNVEFMNQVNQIYAYVQIPLKMSGQNANGELYVYTNKKRLHDPDAELSAFLHLDLENLGATDVSVKMLHHNVQTKFYLADDASYDLVEKHLPILEKHLKKKGYYCSVSVENNSRKINFVEDFLEREQPSAGTPHRYSFDVKA